MNKMILCTIRTDNNNYEIRVRSAILWDGFCQLHMNAQRSFRFEN